MAFSVLRSLEGEPVWWVCFSCNCAFVVPDFDERAHRYGDPPCPNCGHDTWVDVWSREYTRVTTGPYVVDTFARTRLPQPPPPAMAALLPPEKTHGVKALLEPVYEAEPMSRRSLGSYA